MSSKAPTTTSTTTSTTTTATSSSTTTTSTQSGSTTDVTVIEMAFDCGDDHSADDKNSVDGVGLATLLLLAGLIL